jgi:hypothetical protein
VRKSSRTKQILLIISINKDAGTHAQYAQIRSELVELLTACDYGEYALRGVVLIHSAQRVADYPESDDGVDILFGEPFYDEKILDKMFRVYIYIYILIYRSRIMVSFRTTSSSVTSSTRRYLS